MLVSRVRPARGYEVLVFDAVLDVEVLLPVLVGVHPVVHLVDLAATTVHHNVLVVVPIVMLS